MKPASSLKFAQAARGQQQGVVLVIALVLLVILSLVASYNARNVGSAELVSNNTRTAELAMQAAEAVLRHCERGVENHYSTLKTPTLTLSPLITPTTAPTGVTYTWQDLTNWDGTASAAQIRVIGTTALVLSDATGNTYKRLPECMAQYFQAANTRTVVITARGFGPEVAADTGARDIPKGAEVWLQSILTLP